MKSPIIYGFNFPGQAVQVEDYSDWSGMPSQMLRSCRTPQSCEFSRNFRQACKTL